MEQLLAVAEASGVYKPLVLLLGLTGLRWGEAIGLKVKDVHPDKHRIDVYKSATQVGSQIVVGTPKTHEIRTVMYPSALDKVLDLDKPGNALLFENQRGGYLKHPKARTGGSWFAKACDAARVPRMTIHDLRHTAASLMVASGANVKVVQRQLGHASASMTLDVYADLFDDDLDTVRERLDSQLFGHILDTFSGKLIQKSDK
nr:site-specific integrase [Aeriscardovia aeriphila]